MKLWAPPISDEDRTAIDALSQPHLMQYDIPAMAAFIEHLEGDRAVGCMCYVMSCRWQAMKHAAFEALIRKHAQRITELSQGR